MQAVLRLFVIQDFDVAFLGGQHGLDPLDPLDELAVHQAPFDLGHSLMGVVLRLVVANRNFALHLQKLPGVVRMPFLPILVLCIDCRETDLKLPELLVRGSSARVRL